MIKDINIWLLIAGMTLVTFLPRVLPFLLLTGRQLPPAFSRWLSFIPVALMSALLCAGLTAGEVEPQIFGWRQDYLLACLPAVAVAVWRKSILLTVAVGMAVLWLLRFWLY
ncbi:MAG TPA: AzlD domain-containing protein [Firmicutes bacterium]|nr:AzlD domain-containing protein [Bacillota bacterium]